MILGAKEIYMLIKENKLVVHPLTSSSKQMRILDFIADTGIVSYRDAVKSL